MSWGFDNICFRYASRKQNVLFYHCISINSSICMSSGSWPLLRLILGFWGETASGWDKIFYFVGADAFRQKFRPKQRESDATKNLENSSNSTLNKLNLLYESLYESLDFCFFLLFKQFFPLDKSIFLIFN